MISLKDALALAKVECPKQDSKTIEQALLTLIKKNTTFLRTYPEFELNDQEEQQWLSWLTRLSSDEPLAYITGIQSFWSLDLFVTPDTLIPRPDTEILVEAARNSFPMNDEIHVLELRTGSGAIALALATERPKWYITATDFSVDALAVAQKNAKHHHLEHVHFRQGSWYDVLDEKDGLFDLIVSNPPYIDPEDEHLEALKFEPITALIADDNGLADLREIICEGFSWLNGGGWLMVEHGYNQAKDCVYMFEECGFGQVRTLRDFGGNDRVTIGCKSRAFTRTQQAISI